MCCVSVRQETFPWLRNNSMQDLTRIAELNGLDISGLEIQEKTCNFCIHFGLAIRCGLNIFWNENRRLPACLFLPPDSIMNHLCFVPNIARRAVRWQEIVPKVANRSSRGPAESWDSESWRSSLLELDLPKAGRVGPAKGRVGPAKGCQIAKKCIPLFVSYLEMWIPPFQHFFLSKFPNFLVANVHEELVQNFSTCLLKSLNFKW